ncbi:hypothetical protein ACOMHN_016471 [Nucella lapillus]
MAAPLRLVEGREGGEPRGTGSEPGPSRSITERGLSAKSASETRGYVFEAPTAGALTKEALTLVGDVCVDPDMVGTEEKEEKMQLKEKKKYMCRVTEN